MQDFYTILSVISMLLTVCGILGGFWAFRNGMTKTANEVQERVIHALETEMQSMRQRLDDMKDENTRLRLIIETICAALKSYGMLITIDGDMVSIRDISSGGTTTARIHTAPPTPHTPHIHHDQGNL